MINFSRKQKSAIYFFSVLAVAITLLRGEWGIPFIGLTVCCLFSRPIAERLFKALEKLGHFNSIVIMAIAFFALLTPFSLIYRLFWQNHSFKKNVSSTFRKKRAFSSFENPF